ncbi:hypothetical protein A3J78_02135 [Candidatus Beckwithbacteria bacterium RBG_13_35_6]|uniref:Ribulose-phosphate 3-epimerase n=1 Tax=Candidatus Beckwithbacteria bacterium RBG_13_35_6 TaxID=1797456 RepID=A0A1F5DCA6_9BACT|nr:MAG: hypothetical protein A3J78_02135 [Candidatus Beckwithbacteria bacterium RBG_13_35_6]
MVQIIPNITTNNVKEAQNQLFILQKIVKWIHIDVIDKRFSDTSTLTLEELKGIKIPKKLVSIIHFSVGNPEKQIDLAYEIGAKIIISQIEAVIDQKEFVDKVLEKKMKIGLSLDAGTGMETIKAPLLPKLDMVLVMTIKTGWTGRSFIKARLLEVKKLKKLKEKNDYKYKIAVDGGINEDTIKDCVAAGAQVLFMHSAIWKHKDIKTAINKLEALAKKV